MRARPAESEVSDELKVYTKKETQKLICLSGRTWDREERTVGRRRRRAFHQIESVIAPAISPRGSTLAVRGHPPATLLLAGSPSVRQSTRLFEGSAMSIETAMLRAELLMLKTRYDYYAFSPAIYTVVKTLKLRSPGLSTSFVRDARSPRRPILLAGSRRVSPTAQGERSQWVS
jgi:hypothetical protein